MAFTINYDGTGIIAYADGTSDTSGGTWRELGGGTISFNPDVYLYGSGSIASKYASKTGYTYIDGITPLNFSTSGEYLYILVNVLAPGPFDTLVNTPFNLVMGATTSTLREYTIASKDDSNGWTGGWKSFVVDPSITSTIGSGNAITAIDTIGVWIDTNVSVRAESIFQSMIISANGITFTGSPTVAADGWKELALWCTDYTNRAFPFLEVRGKTYFMKGGIVVGNGSTATVFSAQGNSIECEETSFYNGTAWVSTMPATANTITTTTNSSIDWTNVSITGYINNRLNINTSVGNASAFTGGSIKLLNTLTAKSTDVFNGVVMGTYNARTLGSEKYEACTFDGSSALTLGATANFANNNTTNGTSGVISIITNDLSKVATCQFNSSGSNHGVELTSIGSGSMTWDCVTTGFDTGVTGSPVTPTNTGNEDIYVSATTGTLTISVASGATIPSIRSAGATINVVAGQVTTTITVRDIDTGNVIQGARVYLVGSGGALDGVTIFNTLTDVDGKVSDTRSLAVAQDVIGRVRLNTSPNFYKTVPISETISNISGLTLNVSMIPDI